LLLDKLYTNDKMRVLLKRMKREYGSDYYNKYFDAILRDIVYNFSDYNSLKQTRFETLFQFFPHKKHFINYGEFSYNVLQQGNNNKYTYVSPTKIIQEIFGKDQLNTHTYDERYYTFVLNDTHYPSGIKKQLV